MTITIVLAVVAFLVVATMLSRQSSKSKKRAIADLEEEKKSVGTFDIFELVASEVNALGLLDIDGSQDIPHAVLLKVWSDSEHIIEACAGREHLRYIVADGIGPAGAAEEDVRLECTEQGRAHEPGADS